MACLFYSFIRLSVFREIYDSCEKLARSAKQSPLFFQNMQALTLPFQKSGISVSIATPSLEGQLKRANLIHVIDRFQFVSLINHQAMSLLCRVEQEMIN